MVNEKIQHLQAYARLLDESIPVPGTAMRIGLDPLLDLIPGVGDVLGVIASAYIVMVAYQMRLPRVTLLRMAVNLGVDALVGAVPVIGAVFDAGWKANMRNVALIERHAHQAQAGRRDLWFLLLLGVGLALTTGVAGYASIAILAAIIRAIGGG